MITLKHPPELIVRQISPTFYMGLIHRFIMNNDDLFPKRDVKSFYDFSKTMSKNGLLKRLPLTDG